VRQRKNYLEKTLYINLEDCLTSIQILFSIRKEFHGVKTNDQIFDALKYVQKIIVFDNCDSFFQLEDNMEHFFQLVRDILQKSYFIKVIMVTNKKDPIIDKALQEFNLMPKLIKLGELDALSAAKLLISLGKDKLPRNLRNEYIFKGHILFTHTKLPKYPCKIMQINYRL